MNLNPILNLSPNLKQVVRVPTRLKPDAILDPIITTLWRYYQEPITKPPINPNKNSKGKPSDHLIVIMEPLMSALDMKKREYQFIQTRPINQCGIDRFGRWIMQHNWHDLYTCKDVNKKAEVLRETVMSKFYEFFPVKTIKLSSDDDPWVSEKVKQLDRAQKREFQKNQESDKWKKLHAAYMKTCEKEKKRYAENIVSDLKSSNPSKWYSKLKRMSGQNKDHDEINVTELDGIYEELQAEIIADHYAQISNEYEPIKSEDFEEYMHVPKISPVTVEPEKIVEIIKRMNHKASTLDGDLPVRIIKEFDEELSLPICHMVSSCLSVGLYPKMWKIESVTPVPKVFPPEQLKDLRKISGLLNFSKIADKVIAELITEDMSEKRDESQYGNQKKISIQHYLIKMLHKILTGVDKNSQDEAFCAILHLVDWSQAFDRQNHKLGVESFIANGVRPALVPLLVNFFQDRKMSVKWKGHKSTLRSLNGGGPQGGTLGIEEYLSQSNGNTDFLNQDEKYKYIDDLSMLELISLISIGIASYNFKEHVAADIGIDSNYLPPENNKSQQYIDNIEQWTEKQEMKLNTGKSKYMIINYTKNYKVNTRLYMQGELMEQVSQTRLLGVILQDNLSFKANTENITRNAYKRMSILHKLGQFSIPVEDMLNIYILYIRSVLEQSAVVWQSTITKGEQLDLERVQKCALRIILKDNYGSYQEALELCDLETLKSRRNKLSLNFALKCTKNEKTKDMFPLTNKQTNNRIQEKYSVTKYKTGRLANSSIPFMQRQLNKHAQENSKKKV